MGAAGVGVGVASGNQVSLGWLTLQGPPTTGLPIGIALPHLPMKTEPAEDNRGAVSENVEKIATLG